MNQFRVHPEQTVEFERAWRERNSYLDEVPGFREFHLLRGPDEDEAILYASHTTWNDEDSFRSWTHSDAFRKAHARGGVKDLLLGPPRFIGWTAVLKK